MNTTRKSTRKIGSFSEVVGDQAECARKRIAVCEKFGLPVDPADVAILEGAK